MSENEDLLIDFNISPSSEKENRIACVKHTRMSTNSITLMQATVPIYKLLNNDDTGITEYSENNPFDKMDKQAVLYGDPFERVLNAALTNSPTRDNGSTNVQTGTLISIDSPTESKIFFPASANDITLSVSQYDGSSDFFNVSPMSDKSSAHSQQSLAPMDRINENFINNCVHESSQSSLSHDNENKCENNSVHSIKDSPLKPGALPKPDKSPGGGARTSGRTKSNSLKLLKYSLSNSRSDADKEGSPTVTVPENTLLKLNNSPSNNRLQSKSHIKIDESIEDLSETKPNWIDSLTDLDALSDTDSDLERLNFPMLNRSLSELELKAENGNDDCTDSSKKKSPLTSMISNRDELLKKLESIKHKTPSPTTDTDNLVATSVESIDDFEPRTPLNQFSIVPDCVKTDMFAAQLQQRSDNASSLIQNLKKFVEQCDDKTKQSEANDLLQTLSSILGTGENQQKFERKLEKEVPQTMIRQRTFNIDKNENESHNQSMNGQSDSVIERVPPVIEPESSEAPVIDVEHDTAEESQELNPGLSHVLKEIQQMWGNAQVNVLQTNIPSTEGQNVNSHTNPTYIVVMGTPSGNDMTVQSNSTNASRQWRSQSLNENDRPSTTIRATQLKTQPQAQFYTSVSGKSSSQDTTARPAINRRSSFNAATPSKIASSVPNYTPARRRSIQVGASSLTPIAKTRTSLVGGASSSPAISRRRSFVSSPTRELPQKVKTLKPSHGTIKKPPPPPAARNFKIRVKESLSGRSAAPVKAIVPMNRVASLVNINDSVMATGIPKNPRRSLVTSTPKFGEPKIMQPLNTGGIPRFTPQKPATEAAVKPLIRNGTYIAGPSSRLTDTNATSSVSSVTHRRSLSDNRPGPSRNLLVTQSHAASQEPPVNLNRFAPTRFARLSLPRMKPVTQCKENKKP